MVEVLSRDRGREGATGDGVRRSGVLARATARGTRSEDHEVHAMSPSSPWLSLTRAEIVDLRVDLPVIELWLENLRWLGVVFVGILRLERVTQVSSREPRCADDTYPLEPGFSIREAQWKPGRVAIACHRATGPGEADTPTYTFAFATLSTRFRPSLWRSVRAAVGFYPMRHDRRGLRFGPGPRSFAIADLRRSKPPS